LAVAVTEGTAAADRSQARALVEEGKQLGTSGQEKTALLRYEQAIEADVDYLPAYEAAAPIWIRQRKLSRAETYFGKITLRHPDYAQGWSFLADVYRRQGKYELAVTCYQSYEGLRPSDPDGYLGMAAAQKQSGDEAGAAASLRHYLELEHRAQRAQQVTEVRAELNALEAKRAVGLERVRELIAEQRFASARAELATTTASLDRMGELLDLWTHALLGSGASNHALITAALALIADPSRRDGIHDAWLASGYRAILFDH
jgi:tetratricopeptide (TPR) repeat protein